MKQLYYSIIFPYISYAILAWGSAYKTHINKVHKLNKIIPLGLYFLQELLVNKQIVPLPLLNLLDVLTVNDIYRFQTLKFTHLWHKGLLPKLFQDFF